MKIAYDYQAFGYPFGGVPRYFTSIYPLIAAQQDVEATIFAGLHANVFLQHVDKGAVAGMYFARMRRPSLFALKQAINRRWSKQTLQRFAPDILHETYFHKQSLLPAANNVHRVVTVYDMISEQFFHESDRDDRIEAKKAAVQRADHVFCISESTRMDLLSRISLNENKVSVAHLGFSRFQDQDEGDIPNDYILFVGERTGYKNFACFLAAYASCKDLKDHLQLVCVGGGNGSDIMELARDLRIPENKVIHKIVTDAELGTLYRHAAAFIYPSLYEGFGIPLLEAMSCGCPVVCSNTSCFPEVAGEAAEYFDPMHVESMQAAICKVVFDGQRANHLRAAGAQRIKMFSWDQCAKQHLDVYRSFM